jgi:hypothetical protein
MFFIDSKAYFKAFYDTIKDKALEKHEEGKRSMKVKCINFDESMFDSLFPVGFKKTIKKEWEDNPPCEIILIKHCFCMKFPKAGLLEPLFGPNWYKFPHPTMTGWEFVIQCKVNTKSTPIKLEFDCLRRTLSLSMKFCLVQLIDNKIF